MRLLLITALVLVAGLAGCTEKPAPVDPAAVTITVWVEDSEAHIKDPTESATVSHELVGAVVHLTTSQDSWTQTTDYAGRASFSILPPLACTITAELKGYRSAAQSLSCRWTQSVSFTLHKLETPAPAAQTPQAVAPSPAKPLPPGVVTLDGTVSAAGHAVPARLALDAPNGSTTRTSTGAFHLETVPGDHVLRVEAGCWGSATIPLHVAENAAVDVLLSVLAPPPQTPSLQAIAGPGPGMLTLTWTDAANATHFELQRSGYTFYKVAHSLAYTVLDAAPTDAFSVVALDDCGQRSPPSTEAVGSPLPGRPLGQPEGQVLNVSLEKQGYRVYSENGGVRSWRIVSGTGYKGRLVTTPQGWIVNDGSGRLAVSHNAGETWTSYSQGDAGSAAVAPDGDVVAVTVSNGLGVAYRYSASAQRWAMNPMPLPGGFAEPSLSVLKGPFVVQDQVTAYACILQGGTAILLSFDCLTYAPTTLATASSGDDLNLTEVHAALDANRDWMDGFIPDNGVGIFFPREIRDPLALGGLVQPWAVALQDSLPWRGVVLPPFSWANEHIDSAGAQHAAVAEDRGVTYWWSRDGTHWDSLQWSVHGQVLDAKLCVNAGLDQAVIAERVLQNDGREAIRLVRWRNLDSPTFVESLDVGDGLAPAPTSASSIGLPALGPKSGFELTCGLLPSGKAVVSFRDDMHPDSAIAIEE